MESKLLVKSLWISPVLPDLQRMCINSFIRNEIEFHLYTYDRVENLPKGVIIKNANEILDKQFIFKDNKDSYATFSDWFRIKLLYDKGGWWVDCDILFIKDFDFDEEYVFATEKTSRDGNEQIDICNAAIKMPKKSNLGKNILSRIEKHLEKNDNLSIKWTELGAGILTEEIINCGLEYFIVIPEAFCPYDYNNFRDLALNKEIKLDAHTFCVHLWNSMWNWNKLNPMELIENGSLLSRYKSSH